MITPLVLILALFLDRIMGEPRARFHPTVYMGKAIERLSFLQGFRPGGVVLVAVALGGAFLTYAVLKFLPLGVKLPLAVYLLKTTFSWRGLKDYALPVKEALESGDLARARELLAYLVGRPRDDLGRGGAASASVESIAENIHDSVLSPLFYFALLSPLGLEAGVSGALFYRAVNTLDAMVGYPGYGLYGLPPARLDDALNYIPARASALFIVLFSRKRESFSVLREHGGAKKPNAALPMAAMAGALGVKLTKPGAYTIGRGYPPEPKDIAIALNLVDRVVVLFALVIIFVISLCTVF